VLRTIAIAIALATLVPSGLAAGSVIGRPATAVPQKKCRIAIKIVRHKKKRVRVCHPVKPKPKPRPPKPPPPLPPPPPLSGTGGLHSTAGVWIHGAPEGAAVGFGSLWVRTDTEIDRIDEATNVVTATIEGLPPAPTDFAQEIGVGEGAVWTSNIYAGSVSRIDPATNKVVATIPVWPINTCSPATDSSGDCSAPVGIATTPGAVWVALHHQPKVVRIDPATNTVVATVSASSAALAAADGVVYAGGGAGFGGGDPLERIDPATNTVSPVLDAPDGCDWKAAEGTHVWLATGRCVPGSAGSLEDVDATSRTVAGRVDLNSPVIGVATGPEAVWAVTLDELVRIDPGAHAVTGAIVFPAGATTGGFPRVAAGAGSVWLALPHVAYRIGG
jgi:virginiamycin B lyase